MRRVKFDEAFEAMGGDVEAMQACGYNGDRRLTIDGKAGKLTRGGAFYVSEPHDDDLVQAAYMYLRQGAREIGGNNRGPFVAHFFDKPADHVFKGPAQWCAAFTSRCLLDVYGEEAREFQTWGARRMGDKFERAGARVDLSEIEHGDIITWERTDSLSKYAGHVGVVCYVDDAHVCVVEGNAGRHGRVRVWRYDRPACPRWGKDKVWKVARPDMVLGDEDDGDDDA